MIGLAAIIALVWAVAAGAQDIPAARAGAHQAVVFDIDGTLTPSVWAFHIARPDAAAAVQAFADAGVLVVYLSARRRLFRHEMPEWLAEHGFPDGPIYLAETPYDRADTVAFKSGILTKFTENRWQIVAAYGDSSSDFAAYAAAGIPVDHVFALRRWANDDCQSGVFQGCYSDWANVPRPYPRPSFPASR